MHRRSLYRLALRLYPRSFRKEYESEMLLTYGDMIQADTSFAARTKLVLILTWDTLVSATREWFRPTTDSVRSAGPFFLSKSFLRIFGKVLRMFTANSLALISLYGYNALLARTFAVPFTAPYDINPRISILSTSCFMFVLIALIWLRNVQRRKIFQNCVPAIIWFLILNANGWPLQSYNVETARAQIVADFFAQILMLAALVCAVFIVIVLVEYLIYKPQTIFRKIARMGQLKRLWVPAVIIGLWASAFKAMEYQVATTDAIFSSTAESTYNINPLHNIVRPGVSYTLATVLFVTLSTLLFVRLLSARPKLLAGSIVLFGTLLVFTSVLRLEDYRLACAEQYRSYNELQSFPTAILQADGTIQKFLALDEETEAMVAKSMAKNMNALEASYTSSCPGPFRVDW